MSTLPRRFLIHTYRGGKCGVYITTAKRINGRLWHPELAAGTLDANNGPTGKQYSYYCRSNHCFYMGTITHFVNKGRLYVLCKCKHDGVMMWRWFSHCCPQWTPTQNGVPFMSCLLSTGTKFWTDSLSSRWFEISWCSCDVTVMRRKNILQIIWMLLWNQQRPISQYRNGYS